MMRWMTRRSTVWDPNKGEPSARVQGWAQRRKSGSRERQCGDWACAVLVFFGDGKSVSEMFWVLWAVWSGPGSNAQMPRCLAAHCPLPRDGYERGKSVKRGRVPKVCEVWSQATRIGPVKQSSTGERSAAADPSPQPPSQPTTAPATRKNDPTRRRRCYRETRRGEERQQLGRGNVVGRPRKGGGTARTLFLTGSGQCLGAAVCGARLLLCLVTGRGGVEMVSIRSADVQW
ncbi:hypothetical protein B0T18DRAFT_86856 [Schizothecium vesticola]|uniref:Uncharacterized protein n=1 Tax=Schizothecium vesticola TaxID=314040 RepID=A0AA40F7L8_9PEZI|nr:hypothetical protein B0T18DRAFT_86856 [Schizothecium vesticola]